MTVREMVAALVEARHTLGSEKYLRARTKLAADLGCSEQSVRNWLNDDTTPSNTLADKIRDLYHKENANGQQGG